LSGMRDHYETLGVSREATAAEIKAAFRKLARKHHPDKNPGDDGATERYQRVQRAYDVLSDEESRASYDQTGSDQKATPLDLRARNVMARIWSAYVMQANPGVKPLNFMRESLTSWIDQAERNIRRLTQVASHRGKLRMKTSDAENLFECVLDQLEWQADEQLPQLQAELQAFLRARELLADYDSTEPAGWTTTSYVSTGTGYTRI